ncbi:hypothetical protein BGL72_03860 [Helicobacter pylori]|nr:hypothetical protein BGL72_03860 [Helicobacter pylori]
MIAKTLRDIFIYSKNDSFKVVGDTLAMNTPFKEPFILAFVRAKAPCFRKRGRFYILDAQN